MTDVFSPAAVRTLEETPFDASQTIEKVEEGRWRITAEMPDSRLIDGWLAMWSDDLGIVSVRKEILEASSESVRQKRTKIKAPEPPAQERADQMLLILKLCRVLSPRQ